MYFNVYILIQLVSPGTLHTFYSQRVLYVLVLLLHLFTFSKCNVLIASPCDSQVVKFHSHLFTSRVRENSL